ncbi:MAG: DNA mismatch repair endonuclease MutL [Saprospiraceae bacterium]
MADIIQLLPDAIANQIAAGEVIQRPASVVKELLENSVDAGSTNIKLIIKEAGKTLIQVIDNGCGMSETDARMAFERHATSKIRSAADLFAIRTMGFRGEAMASMAAVAHVEMRTRRQTDELGVKLVIAGSEVVEQEACQCVAGTSISVKNLFYNVPARRNFLKSNTVEMRRIMDEFQRVAIANPDIFFQLHHNNSEIFHLPAGNLRQRIVGVFGNHANKKLVPVQEETDVLQLYGFVGKPEFARKMRGEQLFFVNNRFIKSSYLNHAVVAAYEDLINKDTHPLYVIFIDIDPARIDINVHPTKQEIKFDDERLIYNYLKVAVRHALGQFSITPTLDFSPDHSFSQHKFNAPRRDAATPTMPKTGGSNGGNWSPSITNIADRNRQQNNLDNWQKLYEDLDESTTSGKEPFADEHQHDAAESMTIGSNWSAANTLDDDKKTFSEQRKEPYQIHSTYIVSQIKSGFLLIDQQAAHERILYEQYLEQLENAEVSTQQALFPKNLILSPADAEVLKEILPQIQVLGFDIAAVSETTFAINGTPASLGQGKSEEQIIENLLAQYRTNVDLKLEVTDNIARSLARSAAIKRGQSMTEEEMTGLIDQLFACSIPFKSPSGHNCFITFDLDDLQKQFIG